MEPSIGAHRSQNGDVAPLVVHQHALPGNDVEPRNRHDQQQEHEHERLFDPDGLKQFAVVLLPGLHRQRSIAVAQFFGEAVGQHRIGQRHAHAIGTQLSPFPLGKAVAPCQHQVVVEFGPDRESSGEPKALELRVHPSRRRVPRR